MPRDKLFRPHQPWPVVGEITELYTRPEWGRACEKAEWCGIRERSVGEAVVALASEGMGDTKGPLLDLTGSHCRT